jgi:hypothetical protein
MISLSSIAAEKKDKTPYLGIKDFKYTQEQIDNLQNQVEYKKHKYSITCSSYSMSLSKAKLKSLTNKCKKKLVTPFRMGIYLIKDGKKDYKGNAEIYIFDKDGKKLVESEKESLKKLCPSWGGKGGYFGEVPYGTYEVVIVVRLAKDVLVGKKFKATFEGMKASMYTR